MKANAEKRRDRFCSVAVWLMLLAVSITLFSLSSAIAADTQKSAKKKIDVQQLTGRWLRPDGGYILELTAIGKDGTLKASYFNPRPINVAEARYTLKDGRLTIFIELRDVNYPGSRYKLEYEPETDRLAGIYFQAVQGETYNVSFVRIK
jgi:hypothetical protein